jgi:hypothetical protein
MPLSAKLAGSGMGAIDADVSLPIGTLWLSKAKSIIA